MKLDYRITELLHPHFAEKRGFVYDHLNWTVWISNEELLNDINETFDYNFELEKKNEVSEEVASAMIHYIEHKTKYIGTYGTDYDCDLRF